MVKKEKVIEGIYAWVDKLIEPHLTQQPLLNAFQDVIKTGVKNMIAPELKKFEKVLSFIEDQDGNIDFNTHLDSVLGRLKSSSSTLWKGENFNIENNMGNISVNWSIQNTPVLKNLFGNKMPVMVFKEADFNLLKSLIK